MQDIKELSELLLPHQKDLYEKIEEKFYIPHTKGRMGDWKTPREIAEAIGIPNITQVHTRGIIFIMGAFFPASHRSRSNRGTVFYIQSK